MTERQTKAENIMKNMITIRTYQAGDLAELQRITIESFGGISLDNLLEAKFGAWSDHDWRVSKAGQIADDCVANPSGVFVAMLDDTIIGYITTRVDAVSLKGRIPNLAVSEKARGSGLGRRLIDHALDYFRTQGMKIAQIETMATNPIGQHLYPSCGFEEISRQVHYAMKL